jgi:Heterokaryon incompatibility protein (HET)
MEGFFAPPRDRVRAVKVPFVANLDYDGPGPSFSGFAGRKGFSAKDGVASSLDIQNRSVQEIASLLQSWLFFGLLDEFFGKPINRLLFVERHDVSGGSIWMDQDIVHDLFIDWQKQLVAMSSTETQRRRKYIEEVLRVALAKSELFDQFAPDSSDSSIPAVALSVKLLILLLQSIVDDTFDNIHHPFVDFFRQTWFVGIFLERKRRSTAYRKMQEVKEQKLFLPLPPGNEKPSPAARLLLNRLTDNGWCIHQAFQACQTYDYSIVNYMSFLRRKIPDRVTHKPCAFSNKCIANDVNLSDRNSYKQRHVEDDCTCELISVPTDEVLSIIEKGGVPIISLRTKKDQLHLKVVKCQPWNRFAAISHVWSDGLGNATANALPRCQVARLNQRMSEREGEQQNAIRRRDPPNTDKPPEASHHYFWMDTLCIPAGRQDDTYLQDAKSKAISRMAPVYARATHVLILDSELESSTFTRIHADGSHNDDEVSAHVLCSAWMGRTWTLQEAVLARSCTFQLANGPRSLKTDSWIQFFAKDRWSGLTRIFERGGQLQEERLDLRSREARRLRTSPLMRHITRLSSQFPALVIRALQEDKKYLSTLASTPERTKAVSALRVPQFIRAWNSLLDRSTTQPEDRHGIFANLLDFNAHHIRRLPDDQRMPKLIRSCAEIPLSLLYNSGPKYICAGNPENDWIPSEVAGNKLAGDGVMKMSDFGLLIDTTRCSLDSLLIYLIPLGVSRSPSFRLQDQRSGRELVIDIQGQSEETNALHAANSQEGHDASALACLIIDKSTGSSSRNGYAATGVSLTVTKRERTTLFLSYDAPLIAWMPEQCSARPHTSTSVHSPELLIVENVRHRFRFYLNYDATSWGPPLPRRPLLSTHPTYPALIPYITTLTFILLSGSISLILGITGFVQTMMTLCVWFAELLVGVLVVFPFIHYFCMLTSYKAWVATFDENWVPESRWAGWAWAWHVGEIVGAWVADVLCGWGWWNRRARARRKGKGRSREVNRNVEEGGWREREPLLGDGV